MSDSTLDIGRCRRWRDGERLYVESDFVTMVYVVTEDPTKHGLGLHDDDQMCVVYIPPVAAAPWTTAQPTPAVME